MQLQVIIISDCLFFYKVFFFFLLKIIISDCQWIKCFNLYIKTLLGSRILTIEKKGNEGKGREGMRIK
jgi:hypothetical protein